MSQLWQADVAATDREPLPALISAVQQFNAGEYFVCHETLEDLWLDEKGQLRSFYQGILQIGAGLYHLQRGNERGALILLARGRMLLAPFSPACLGIDVTSLVRETQRVEAALRTRGLPATQRASSRLFPHIRRVLPGQSPGK